MVPAQRPAAPALLPIPALWCLGLNSTWKALLAPYSGQDGMANLLQIAVPLAVAVLWFLFRPRQIRRGVLWAATVVGVFGGAAVLGAAFSPGAPFWLSQFGSVVCTVANIAFALLWSEVFAACSMAQAGINLAGSYLFGAVVYFAIGFLPAQLHAGSALLMPLLCGLCLSFSLPVVPHGGRGSEADAPVSSRSDAVGLLKRIPWRVTMVIAVFSFASGVNRYYSDTVVDILSTSVAGLVILAFTLLFARRTSLFSVYRVALPVMMLGLLVGVVAGGESVVAQVCINASYAFAQMLLLLFVSDRSRRFGLPALFSYSVARACTGAAFWLGGALMGAVGAFAGLEGTVHTAIIYAAALFGVAVAAFLWLSNGSMGIEGQASDEERPSRVDAGDEPAHGENRPTEGVASGEADGVQPGMGTTELFGALVKQRCEGLAQEYHLSARELDVLVLLAWGKSARRIEEALTLSNSTIKTHIRHIYGKLGIHSRDELDVLIDAYGRDAGGDGPYTSSPTVIDSPSKMPTGTGSSKP